MKLIKFVLALAIISFVSCKDISDKINSDGTDTEITDDDTKADLYAEDTDFLDNETDTKSEGIIETDDTEKVVDTEKEVVAVDINEERGNKELKPGKFYIIAGSFKDYKKAQKLYKQLASKGYTDTQILDPVNEYSRVVIRSFDNETQARSELKRLRKQYNDNSIWLHIAK